MIDKIVHRLPRTHRVRSSLNGANNIVIAGAAANIAVQLLANRRLVEVVPVASNHIDGGHNHARRAEAALEPVLLMKSSLHRMKFVAVRQAFEGRPRCSVILDGERGTGLNANPVDVNGAGTALAGIAADMRTGEPQMLTQILN